MTNLITLQRQVLSNQSSIGRLLFFGDSVWTLEDTKRKHKVFGETRIPPGRYKLNLRNEGEMNQRYAARFPDSHRGMIWLRHVPQFEYIYIHPGNTAGDTLGCILVGMSMNTDRINSSVVAYRRIYGPICEAIESDEGCAIEILDEQ